MHALHNVTRTNTDGPHALLTALTHTGHIVSCVRQLCCEPRVRVCKCISPQRNLTATRVSYGGKKENLKWREETHTRPQITEQCQSGANESHFILHCSQGIIEEGAVFRLSLNGLRKYVSVCRGKVCDCASSEILKCYAGLQGNQLTKVKHMHLHFHTCASLHSHTHTNTRVYAHTRNCLRA